jgi:hypothetical protein
MNTLDDRIRNTFSETPIERQASDALATQLMRSTLPDVLAAPVLVTSRLPIVLATSRKTRKQAMRRVIPAGVVAATVVCGLAIDHGRHTEGPQLSQPHSAASSVPVLDTAYVVSRTTQALSAASSLIAHTRSEVLTGNAAGHADDIGEAWGVSDATSVRSRVDDYGYDNVLQTSTFTTAPAGSTVLNDTPIATTVLSYPNRTWSQSERTEHFSDGISFELVGPAAQQLRAQLASGVYDLSGTATVDGHQVLDLRSIDPGSKTTDDVYVDARTFLVIRHVETGPDTNGKPVVQWRTDTTYLADTPANQAAFKPIVPAGFRKVADSVG